MKLRMKVKSHHEYSPTETLVQLLAAQGKDACNFTVPNQVAADYPLGTELIITLVKAPKVKDE